MRRILNVFLSCLLLFTSVFVSNNRVYAEEDFTVTVSLDEEEGVIIRSSDPDWIKAYNTISKEENGEWFSGSAIYMINEETGLPVKFETVYYPEREGDDQYDINFEVRTDDQGDYLYISKDILIDRFMVYDEEGSAGTKYYFQFKPYGYDLYTTDVNTEGGYVVFSDNILKQPPALRIEEAENGNLIISGKDTADFFDNFLYDNPMQPHLVIDGENYFMGGSFYLNDENNLVLPKSAFISYITEDKTIELHLPAYGYVSSIQTIDYVIMQSEEPAVTVTQDTETGDLWITSENQQWLDEMFSLNSDEITIRSEGTGTSLNFGTEAYYDYVRFSFDSENKVSGFTILNKALLAEHIHTSEDIVEITFPSTSSYESFSVEMEGLDACKASPEGLKVQETEEGIRFYFDNPTQEQLDYLVAMTHPGIRDYMDGNGKYAEGSSIEIYHGDGSTNDLNVNNVENIESDGSINRWRNEIILSSDGNYVYIPRERIQSSNIVNSDSIEYKAVARVYGYYGYYTPSFQIKQYGVNALPDGFSINAYMDEDMNLYIRLNNADEAFLEALAKEEVYEDGNLVSEGSTIFIYG